MSSVDRRAVLRTGGALVALGAVAGTTSAVARADDRDGKHEVRATPFRHGVASGDPLPDGVVIWTRVTPTEQAVPGSGAGPAVDVEWAVATDPGMQTVVRRGRVRAEPASDHTVKVDVRGLAADTRYWYCFRLGEVGSRVGRTRTAPKADATVARLRFGVVSCTNWQAGFFAAYRYLADRGDLDAVLHLGDYLYEYEPGGYQARNVVVRPHDPPRETVTLADYRQRHAQYKTDADLQALHAAVPWIATLDDHESANDAWRDGAENHQPATEGPWAVRKAASRRAYREWMPVRVEADRVYRRLRFGRLAELTVLDLRAYRSQQAGATTAVVDDPNRTITGRAQLDFLVAGLVASSARWKLVGNPVMIAPLVIPPLPADVTGPVANFFGLPAGGLPINPDQWDGYTADRRTVFSALQRAGVRDTVFLTGDIHSSWASDLPIDAGTYPLTPSVATEFVCTSVTSDNIDDALNAPPRATSLGVETAIQAANRHIKFVELDSHGASVLDVTPQAVQMDWFYVSDRTRPDATLAHGRSFRTRSGTQRVEPVAAPVPVGARA